MIGILNRWRQFGRRYFWPHLLLGMVAATLGASSNLPGAPIRPHCRIRRPALTGKIRPTAPSTAALLQDAHRRPTFSVDYWQQHALRTVIRHLSFALAPQAVYARVQESEAEAEPPLQVAQLALLSTLNALLTHEPKPPTIIRHTHLEVLPTLARHQTGLWVAQVQGIRAGPAALV